MAELDPFSGLSIPNAAFFPRFSRWPLRTQMFNCPLSTHIRTESCVWEGAEALSKATPDVITVQIPCHSKTQTPDSITPEADRSPSLQHQAATEHRGFHS